MRLRSVLRGVSTAGLPSGRMRRWLACRLASVVLALAVCGAVVVTPLVVVAADGGSGRPELALAFGSQYGTDLRTHSGVDVSLPAGSIALSATGGTVTFAGLIPATGGDFRVGAVSVRTPNGHIITLSPLGSIGVAKGDSVTLGQPVGVVSASGDGSLAAPHLHLSERVSGRYVDPTHLLSGWFAAYGTPEVSRVDTHEGAEAVQPGGGSTVRALPAPSPTKVTSTIAVRSAHPVALPRLAPQAQAGNSSAGPSPMTALMLAREIVSHPALTLGVKSWEAGQVHGVHAVDSGVVPAASGDRKSDPRAIQWLISSFGYLGVGMVTLAVGLGFALQTGTKSEQSVASHRLGSLFAVRGERW